MFTAAEKNLMFPIWIGSLWFTALALIVSYLFFYFVLTPDKIRKQLSIGFQDSRYESRVWNIYESMKRKALEKGCNVVLDACHISE